MGGRGGAQGNGVTIYATLLGEPSRSVRNDDLAQLLAWGLAQYRVVPVVSAEPGLRHGARAVGQAAARARRRAARSCHVARLGRRADRARGHADVVSLPVARDSSSDEVRVYERGKLVARVPLVAARTIDRPGSARAQ